jgi:hypothetical protein
MFLGPWHVALMDSVKIYSGLRGQCKLLTLFLLPNYPDEGDQ